MPVSVSPPEASAAKYMVTIAGQKWFTFLQDETNRTGCDFLCGVGLSVVIQHPSEPGRAHCLIRRVTSLLKYP